MFINVVPAGMLKRQSKLLKIIQDNIKLQLMILKVKKDIPSNEDSSKIECRIELC